MVHPVNLTRSISKHVFGHNSAPLSRIRTKLGGNLSHRSTAAPVRLRDLKNDQNTKTLASLLASFFNGSKLNGVKLSLNGLPFSAYFLIPGCGGSLTKVSESACTGLAMHASHEAACPNHAALTHHQITLRPQTIRNCGCIIQSVNAPRADLLSKCWPSVKEGLPCSLAVCQALVVCNCIRAQRPGIDCMGLMQINEKNFNRNSTSDVSKSLHKLAAGECH